MRRFLVKFTYKGEPHIKDVKINWNHRTHYTKTDCILEWLRTGYYDISEVYDLSIEEK